MSHSPSPHCVNVQWVTKKFVQYCMVQPSASPTSFGLVNLRFWRMTFLTWRSRRSPMNPELAPTPMIDLLDPTSKSEVPRLIVPDTLIMRAVVPATADWNAESVVTVTVEPPAPPVVFPFWLAQPSAAQT